MSVSRKAFSAFLAFMLAFTLMPLPVGGDAHAATGRDDSTSQKPVIEAAVAPTLIEGGPSNAGGSDATRFSLDDVDGRRAAQRTDQQDDPQANQQAMLQEQRQAIARAIAQDAPTPEVPAADGAGAGGQSPDSLSLQSDVDYYADEAGVKYYYEETAGGTACITGVEVPTVYDKVYDVEFPEKINGKDVTALGREEGILGFFNAGAVSSITVPKTVRALNASFKGFESLSTVTFAQGGQLTVLPPALFAYSSVSTVTLPDSLTEVSEGLFYDCDYLNGITLPSSVTSIGTNAFAQCGQLGFGGSAGKVVLPANLQTVGETAFYQCERLRAIEVPASVRTIGKGAFEDCVKLADLTLSSGLQEIGDYAFFNCVALESITFSETLKIIGKAAFAAGSSEDMAGQYNMAYTGISVPDNVESIGDFAFCSMNLASVQLGTSQAASKLRTLGSCAFATSSIAEVSLPNSLESLGNVADPEVGQDGMVYANGAFRLCWGLRSIV